MRPQRLKPSLKINLFYRSGKPLRHPKAGTISKL
jgi:hypothetical protein